MKKNIKIRRADIRDLSTLAPLFDGYRQFYHQSSNLKGAENFLEQRLSQSESVVFLACDELKGTGVGFVQLYPTFTSVGMRRKWILNDLFVVAGQRRSGAGRALMQAARDFAQETGAQGLVLETQIENVAGQALYESLGWVKEDDFYVYALAL